jgi:hypothetical protein
MIYGVRWSVECYDLERSGVAAGRAKKKSDSDKRRVEELVGFLLLELGRVIAGLDGLQNRNRVFNGFGLGPSLSPKPPGRQRCFRRAPSKVRVALKPFRPGRCKTPTVEATSSGRGAAVDAGVRRVWRRGEGSCF